MGLRKQTGANEPELSTNRFVGVAGWGAASVVVVVVAVQPLARRVFQVQ